MASTQVVRPPGPHLDTRALTGAHTGRRDRIKRHSFPYALLLPIVAFECLFVVYPIIRGVRIALERTQFGRTTYVGLANFRQMIHEALFWTSVRVTFEFTLSMVVVWIVLGLAVGLLMNWSFAGRGVARALLSIPWAIPDVPVVLTFTIMMDPNFGIINRFASFIPGVSHHIQWLTSSRLAFIAIIMMVGWKGFPFFSLIILSSLQSISEDLYEAAKVDGAGVLARFRSVTLPSLYPTLALLAVLAFIFSFQQFTIIYLSTGGGPGTETSTLAVTIYNQAFQFFNYNYASAVAVAGLILAVVATVVFIVFERRLARSRSLAIGEAAL